jgi:Skp family chaperone for outer membrane proteins
VRFFLPLLAVLLIFSSAAHADKYTHALGDTGYMIREAMQAGANKHAKDLYRQALKKQRAAKQAFNKRALTQSLELTASAYTLAKQARDQALSVTGKKF